MNIPSIFKNSQKGTLTVNGTDSLTAYATGSAAAIGGVSWSETGGIIINGGNITAYGSGRGAGIGGGGYNCRVSSITVNGGNITAYGGKEAGGSGIGGGYGDTLESITITGGTIYAETNGYTPAIGTYCAGGGIESIIISCGDITAKGYPCGIGCCIKGYVNNMTVSGGRIRTVGSEYGIAALRFNSISFLGGQINTGKIGSLGSEYTKITVGDKCDLKMTDTGAAIYDENDNVVRLVTVENPENLPITVDSEAFPYTSHFDEARVYVWLPSGDHIITVGTEEYSETVREANRLIITGGEEGVDYTVDFNIIYVNTSEPLTFSNLYPDEFLEKKIIINENVNADLTLDGLNLKSALPIEIKPSDADVVVRLAEGSVNTLESTDSYNAALQKNDTKGTLLICGTGEIHAKAKYGAAIGSRRNSGKVSGIEIAGGVIYAESNQGAGIGSGYNCACGEVIISGGTLNVSSDYGAGIGSSDNSEQASYR